MVSHAPESCHRIRVEWGGLTSYVDRNQFELCWDGGVSVRHGRLRALWEIDPGSRRGGHFFMGHSLRPLGGRSWRSRTNQGLGGAVMEVEGGPECEIVVETVQRSVSFTVGELLDRRYLRWPVGAKYSGFSLCAMVDGEGPFAVDAEVEAGCVDVRLRHDAFQGASRYGLFVDNQAAWVEPGGGAAATFDLPRALHESTERRSALTLELRLSLSESVDEPVLSSCRYSPVTVAMNGQTVKSEPVYFRSEWAYWVEFVPVAVPVSGMRKTGDLITVRNDSEADVLAVMSAQLRETIEEDLQVVSAPQWLLAGDRCDVVLRCLRPHPNVQVTCRGGQFCGKAEARLQVGEHRLSFVAGSGPEPLEIFVASGFKRRELRIPVYALRREEPSWKIGGTLQCQNHDEASGEIKYAIDYTSRTQMGNYLQFRPEPSAMARGNCANVTPEQWRHWAQLLKGRDIHFSFVSGHAWRNYNLEDFGPDPEVYEACQLMKEVAGDFFSSAHVHEHSRWVYGQLPRVTAATWTMEDARNQYVHDVAAIELIEDIPRQTGQSAPLMSYDYEGGIDYIAAETMAFNNMHLLAAARGAARAYGKPVWGVHNATYWVKAPDDFTKLALNWLNFYMTYAAGGNFAISEDGHFQVPHANHQQGFHSEEPTRLREIIRRFYEYVNTHPRRGRPEVRLAVAQGNNSCELISFPLHFCWLKDQIGHVWGGLGNQPQMDKWEYADPERGLTLLDEWMPYRQDGLHIRHWFTGTPYGQFDVTPIWKTAPDLLAEYKVLVFLGWNTMTPEIYAKLKSYVHNGGTLLMAVPQLSTHTDRTFLETMDELSLIHGGDVRDLFGVKIGSSAMPRVVENRLGKGRAILLTGRAYPGHPDMEPVARYLLAHLGEQAQGDVHLDDPSREVAWYMWKDETGLRNVHLLNTDWTEQENVKSCRLCLGTRELPVEVKEGNITTVTWRRNLGVHPRTQDPFVEDVIEESPSQYRVIVHGWGEAELVIDALAGQIGEVRVGQEVAECALSDDRTRAELRIRLGASTRAEVYVRLGGVEA